MKCFKPYLTFASLGLYTPSALQYNVAMCKNVVKTIAEALGAGADRLTLGTKHGDVCVWGGDASRLEGLDCVSSCEYVNGFLNIKIKDEFLAGADEISHDSCYTMVIDADVSEDELFSDPFALLATRARLGGCAIPQAWQERGALVRVLYDESFTLQSLLKRPVGALAARAALSRFYGGKNA